MLVSVDCGRDGDEEWRDRKALARDSLAWNEGFDSVLAAWVS